MCWIGENCYYFVLVFVFFFFKQKTAYEMRISDWSSDVCSSDLGVAPWLLLPVQARLPGEGDQRRRARSIGLGTDIRPPAGAGAVIGADALAELIAPLLVVIAGYTGYAQVGRAHV